MNTRISSAVYTSYKCIVGFGGISGLCYGTINGYRGAESVCFIKKDLTSVERSGEAFCYGMIIMSSSMCGFALGSLYTALLPVSFPATYYLLSQDEK
jgi:hypothetical protein